jgi:uncharacterized membrane protein
MTKEFLLTIIALGISTYATRLAGFWLLRGRNVSGRVRAALDAVPPAILVAVIAPSVFLQGSAEMVAGAFTLILALLRLPILAVIAGGTAAAAVMRVLLT